MASSENQAQGVFARLKERQEARMMALEQRKKEEQEEKRVEETSEYFLRQFEQNKRVILDLVDKADGLPKDDVPSHFEKISSECQNIQKLLSDSVVFLSAHDQGTAQKQIFEVLLLVTSKQEQLMAPKKKFTFRSKKKGASGASKPETDIAKAESQSVDKKSDDLPSVHTNSKAVKDKKKEKIELVASEVNGQDVNLACLEDCEVQLFGSPSTIHITNATKCKIWSGPVSGSIFLEGCSECEFVLACQQLRVHSTTSSAFSLHITSRVIIEDCSNLTFAPSSWTYPEMGDHYKISGLDREVNNWDKVDDFNWLASSEPSPNWSISHQERTNDS